MAKKTKVKAPRVSDILAAVHRIAPRELAESWDNVGLQVGNPAAPAGKIMVALEVTREVLAEVRRRKVSTLITHHPLIFQPLKSMAETAYAQEFSAELIRAECALIAAHTNLDSVAYGTNGVLADLMGIRSGGRRFLSPAPVRQDRVKFVVFVPESHLEAVIAAMDETGAGVIGDYSHCTFRVAGSGTFKPLPGSDPYIGKVGEMETAEEFRVECVSPRSAVPKLVRAVCAVHPYEEPAYDVYTLETDGDPTAGLGLIGELKKPTTLKALALSLKKKLGATSVGIVGDPKSETERVAILTGAGGSAIRSWRPGTADVLVTGEMTHHDCAEAHYRNVPVILVGHYESEVIVGPRMMELVHLALAEKGFPECEIVVSKDERSPLTRL